MMPFKLKMLHGIKGYGKAMTNVEKITIRRKAVVV
jgi:hypothetical protein